MSPESSALAPAYTCNVCKKTLSLKGPPIIGEQPQQRMQRVSEMLAHHLGTEHKDRMFNIAMAGQQFAGWLTFNQYSHNDAPLLAHAEEVRTKTRQFTKRVVVTDEAIKKQVHDHLQIIDAPAREVVIALLKGVRDVLDETPPPTSPQVKI